MVTDDLQILIGTSDKDLRARIEANHPQWTDELVGEEVERLHSKEFRKWCKDLMES